MYDFEMKYKFEYKATKEQLLEWRIKQIDKEIERLKDEKRMLESGIEPTQQWGDKHE